jgi:hypothetical protein
MTAAVYSSRMPVQQSRGVQKMGGSSGLADVLNVILDQGIVIDAWARVSVIGIEILTIEARVVIASVNTYLRYAEAIGLTELAASPRGASRNTGNGQGDNGGRLSEDDVAAYVSSHPNGVRMNEIEAYFDKPRRELRSALNDLIENEKVRRDERRRLYLPVDGDGNHGKDEGGDEDSE